MDDKTLPQQTPVVCQTKSMCWAGWILTALVVLFMGGGGIAMLFFPAMANEGMPKIGYPVHLARTIIILEIACALVYAIPQTAVLGAILLTGYLGGATASHVRIGEPWFMPVVVGVIVWLGIYLRDARLRALIPVRRCNCCNPAARDAA